MTWVFGSPTMLGSSVCLADVQVSIGSQTFDCLRKVYAIDRNLMAGFAGNVAVGFRMLVTLQQLVESTKSTPGPPR